MRRLVMAAAVAVAALMIGVDASGKGKPGGGGGTITNPAYVYLAQVKGNKPSQLLIATFDGSSKKQLTDESFTEHYNPAWSPDGTKIAYCARQEGASYGIDGIWVVNADGSGSPARIFENDPTGIGVVGSSNLAWSPDGATIAAAGGLDLILVDVATGDATIAIPQGGYVREAAWAPDSSTIAFSGRDDMGSGPMDLLLYDVATGVVTNLTNTPDVEETEPTWSSDGRIAFLDGTNGQSIWVMDEDGTNASQVVGGMSAARRRDLRWSPDAAYLSYLQTDPDVSGTYSVRALYRVRVSTGQVTKVITSNFGVDAQDWNPAWQ